MKRILLIANIRKQQGGITTQVLELKESLENEGYETELISTHGSPKERFQSIVEAFNSAGKCDLIIAAGCSYFGFFPVIVASVAAKIRIKKIIFNFHDGQVQDFLKKNYGIVKLFVGKNEIAVATDYLKKIFEKYGFNAVLIPNHLNSFSNAGNKTKDSSKIRIIWARSFEKLYDPETAIRAALHFKDNPDVEFHFYGTGSYFEYYREKYKNDKIEFLGHIKREDLLEKYGEYDVFLNTALFDNFPMSIVEAGMNKLIVVSSKAGGIPTIYDENEIVFYNSGNTDELIEKLDCIIRKIENYRPYAERLNRHVTKFSWENVRTEWIRLIGSKINIEIR